MTRRLKLGDLLGQEDEMCSRSYFTGARCGRDVGEKKAELEDCNAEKNGHWDQEPWLVQPVASANTEAPMLGEGKVK